MTVVVTDPKQLNKVKPTDSIVFIKDGIATAINSSLVNAGMHTLEEYCVEHGWMPQSVPMPEIQPKPKLLQWLRNWLKGK